MCRSPSSTAANAVEVLVDVVGPAMLRVVGEIADGVIATWANAVTLADHIVPAISRAAGGRTPRVVALLTELGGLQ